MARIAFADRLPAIGLGAGAVRGRDTEERRVPGESRTSDSFDVLGLASFELDLWGKYRRLDEAARAEIVRRYFRYACDEAPLCRNMYFRRRERREVQTVED